MHVVHRDKEGELVLALHHAEREAAPLQRIRNRDDVLVNLFDGHVAVIDRLELDFGRIGDGVPDEFAVVGALEPAAEGVVPTQVCVERLVHRGDVALALARRSWR